jgi:hypothetical protein
LSEEENCPDASAFKTRTTPGTLPYCRRTPLHPTTPPKPGQKRGAWLSTHGPPLASKSHTPRVEARHCQWLRWWLQKRTADTAKMVVSQGLRRNVVDLARKSRRHKLRSLFKTTPAYQPTKTRGKTSKTKQNKPTP